MRLRASYDPDRLTGTNFTANSEWWDFDENYYKISDKPALEETCRAISKNGTDNTERMPLLKQKSRVSSRRSSYLGLPVPQTITQYNLKVFPLQDADAFSTNKVPSNRTRILSLFQERRKPRQSIRKRAKKVALAHKFNPTSHQTSPKQLKTIKLWFNTFKFRSKNNEINRQSDIYQSMAKFMTTEGKVRPRKAKDFSGRQSIFKKYRVKSIQKQLTANLA